MLDAFPPLTPTAVGYSLAAVVMVSFNIWVFLQFFPREGGAPTVSRALVVGYLLISSMFLWVSVLYDLETVNAQIGTTAILFGVQIMMIAPFAWAFATILRGSEMWISRWNWAWPVLLALVMPANEWLMGAVWVTLQGGWSALFPAGPWWWAQGISASVGTVYFFWSMFANMVPLLYWVPLPRTERNALLGLAATALIGPWVVSDLLLGAVLMGIVMALTFLVLLRDVIPSRAPAPGEVRVAVAVAVAFFAMAVGVMFQLAFPSYAWSTFPFAAVMLGTMFGEMVFLAHRVLLALPLSPEERKELAEDLAEQEEELGRRAALGESPSST